MRRRARWLAFALAAAGTIAVPQAASAQPTMRSMAAARLHAFCAANHIPCGARWTQVGGRSGYRLNAKLTITGSGKVVAHAANFYGEMSNEGTGLCMSSRGTQTQGAVASQEYCNGSGNQQWTGFQQGIGGIELSNIGDSWCLTNSGGAAANDNPQTMWPCHGNYYKDEYFLSGGGPGGGSLRLAAETSAFQPNGYCVTSNGSTTAGSPVVEHTCNGSLNQWWSGPITVGPG
jgi:hypothetical protein